MKSLIKLVKVKVLSLGLCLGISLNTVQAGPDPFLGEISWVPDNFAPRGWAFCDGQLLPIAENTALFALLGTTYGGDGRTNFALPDVRSRVMMHEGQGPGLSDRTLGQKGGTETETVDLNAMLESEEVMLHDHIAMSRSRSRMPYHEVMALMTIDDEINAQAQVNNVQPFIVLNCIIALDGDFPSRN